MLRCLPFSITPLYILFCTIFYTIHLFYTFLIYHNFYYLLTIFQYKTEDIPWLILPLGPPPYISKLYSIPTVHFAHHHNACTYTTHHFLSSCRSGYICKYFSLVAKPPLMCRSFLFMSSTFLTSTARLGFTWVSLSVTSLCFVVGN